MPCIDSWRPDPRRPSYVQENHLCRFDNSQPAWLGVAFEWSGAVNTTALSKAILGWVDRHEALRCRFAKDGSVIHLATVDPGAETVDLVELGDYADPGELAWMLEEVFDANTKPLNWPVFVTISRPGCTTLIMEVLGRTLRDRFVVSYMDDRVVPGSDCWARWRTRFLISRCSDPQEVYLWVSRSHEGICLNFRHPGTTTARSAVDRYFAEVATLANGISGALPRVMVDD